MTGERIKQTKEAFEIILANLEEKDVFNVIIFDHNIDQHFPNMVLATESNKAIRHGFHTIHFYIQNFG